ncbi:MAG: TlyA family RNA methyltransferase [Synergistaceae bacterium]|jgi:23S rRNA (cytidine1920-2'-O)/16S rRNA (cytidine1409-2'-O)-methyltransferase|nr:TlyA family RNA methyltransferase [Synergistaceae bacterium]
MAGTLLRLDKILVERGLAASREAACELIHGGEVTAAGLIRKKPASMLPRDVPIEIGRGGGPAWVSRGARKLIKGLDEWGIDPSGLSCVDVGASTGGFTQVLLSRGAAKVAAVDVGYGQLAWVLRNDPRVLIFERMNARYITRDDIGWSADLLTVDASFISLRLLIPNLVSLISGDGVMIALVKPQFEVGRGRAGKGVVRDPALHVEVLEGLSEFLIRDGTLRLSGATYSPIRGPEGNIEFLFLLSAGAGGLDRGTNSPGLRDEVRGRAVLDASSVDFKRIVREAHESGRTDA